MTSNAGSGLNVGIILGEEVPDITELEEVENGPANEVIST